ncbi:hypothetical protein PG994_006221 [Apiospora phragmitis]|uniref:Uncharacterized protein n=1 Tax=Apiospora phragmitis TaxID=2905665 RepID=A0ABR1VH82_9PEZI
MPDIKLANVLLLSLGPIEESFEGGYHLWIELLQSDGDAENFIVRSANSYHLFLTPTSSTVAEWDVSDAVEFCRHTLTKSKAYVVCLFALAEEKTPGEDEPAKHMILSIVKTTSAGAESVGGVQASRFTGEIPRSFPREHYAQNIVTLASHPDTIHSSPNVWQRYNTAGSKGQRFQLQFDHHNVSGWARRYPNPNQEWFVRLDDQAMIPADAVDDEELRYQRWFQEIYPDANQIRIRGDYLTESFLGDPDATQVPADKTFHMAHCVLALRRYWTARKSRKHVCPRDIDYKHVKYCLDALDMWAFPEGPQRSLPISPIGMNHEGHEDVGEGDRFWIDSSDETRLVWRTKVCFGDM